MGILGDIVRRSASDLERREDLKDLPFLEGSYRFSDVMFEIQFRELLRDIYDFKSFSPFLPKDILRDGGDVVLILDDKETIKHKVSPEELEEELKKIKDEIEHLSSIIQILGKSRDILEDLYERLERLREKELEIERRIREKDYIILIEILGKYCPRNYSGGTSRPEIHLMMGTLGKDLKLIATTFIHELMHAYYDHHNPEMEHQYISVIEEPLAECGMLCFVELFSQSKSAYVDLLSYAESEVKNKRYALGVCNYGFGYYLFKDKSNFGIDWVSLYHTCCPTVDEHSAEVSAYKKMISEIKYPCHERACELKLQDILHPARFLFMGETTSYEHTPGVPSDRMFVSDCSGIGKDVEFQKEYLFYKPHHPFEIILTFKSKSGRSFSGVASMMRGSAGFIPPRICIRKDLLSDYVKEFSPRNHEQKRFLFYEKYPSDGISNAEWVALEM